MAHHRTGRAAGAARRGAGGAGARLGRRCSAGRPWCCWRSLRRPAAGRRRRAGCVVQRDRCRSVRLGEPARRQRWCWPTPAGGRLRGVRARRLAASAGAGDPRQPRGRARRASGAGWSRRCSPTRRGDRTAPGTSPSAAVGPLGLAARQATLPAPRTAAGAAAVHLPPAPALRLARLRELDGRTALRCAARAPSSTRCASTSSATTSAPSTGGPPRAAADVVVRTWRPERDRRVLIVLDTARTVGGRVGDAPRLDAAMDAALLLAALAARAGDRVDLLAIDRRVRARVRGPPARPSLLPALVDAMAPLEPDLVEADWPAIVGAVASRDSTAALAGRAAHLARPAAMEEGLLPVLDRLTSAPPVLSPRSPTRGSTRWRPAAATPTRSTRPPPPNGRLLDRAALVAELRRRGRRGGRGPARGAAAPPGRPLPGPQGRRPPLRPGRGSRRPSGRPRVDFRPSGRPSRLRPSVAPSPSRPSGVGRESSFGLCGRPRVGFRSRTRSFRDASRLSGDRSSRNATLG